MFTDIRTSWLDDEVVLLENIQEVINFELGDEEDAEDLK